MVQCVRYFRWFTAGLGSAKNTQASGSWYLSIWPSEKARILNTDYTQAGTRQARGGQDAKFKTNNWENLVRLSKETTVSDFRESLLEKLTPHLDTIAQIARLLTPEATNGIF